MSYAEAFAKHDVLNRAEVDKWKEALSVAADLSGFDLQEMTNGYEFKFIDNISNEILKVISDGPLDVAENLVSVDARVRELNLLRFVGSDKVHMIGICGFSGIGKTTLAKVIYNSMYANFEGRCFCEDVQGVTKRQGLTHVQMQMFVKILKNENLKISSFSEGTKVIKQRMACKPILLVLDDVKDLDQLEALAGSRDWFSPGSLIIFTGKDKQLLRSHDVDEIYDMKILDDYKALELFSLNAFRKRHPTEGFAEFASQIVKYLHGHPLALKVIGRSLYGKSVHVWKSELDRLQAYPNSDILQKLRPSFDGLASDQKRMFLDIACAFIGENRYFTASVLDSSNCSANTIEVLVDKCLITVSEDCLQMHELIQSMAREIIREEFNMPGNHSRRLWISSEDDKDDILNVNKVAEEVKVLVLLLKKNCQNIPIDGQALTRMKNLRILKICFPKVEGCWQPFAVNFSGRLDLLSNKLRLLYWHGLPLESLPSDFYPENIVVIDLSYSNIKQLWTTPKCLRRLKIMKLRYCCNLITTPNFSEITNLEELDLEGCVNMVTVHPSIGMLKRLVVLNMRDCRRARSFPSKLEMYSLQVLNLSGCQRPEAFWSRCWTAISGFIWNQQHPQRSVSLEGLHMLKYLNLSYCNLEQVPESIGGLSCLEDLYLKGNNFTSLPGSFSQLSSLGWLFLEGCKKLEVLPELPPSLQEIDASDCTSLRSFSSAGLHMLEYLNLSYCNLEQVPDAIGGLSCLHKLNIKGNNFTSLPGSLSQLPRSVYYLNARDCISLYSIMGSIPIMSERCTYLFNNCQKLFENLAIDSRVSISETQCHASSVTSQGSTNRFSFFLHCAGIQNNGCELFRSPESSLENMDIMYHGNSISNWFTNKSMGNHVKVELPLDCSFSKLRGYGICVVFKRKKPSTPYFGYFGYDVKNFDGVSLGECNPYYYREYFQDKPISIDESDMIWLHYTTKEIRKWKEANNFVTFCFYESEEIEVKEMGVRLVWDEDLDQEGDLSMFQDLPTLSEHGGVLCWFKDFRKFRWSW